MSQGASTSYHYWFYLILPEHGAELVEIEPSQAHFAGLHFLRSHWVRWFNASLYICKSSLASSDSPMASRCKIGKKNPRPWPRINESGCIYQLLLLVLFDTPGTSQKFSIVMIPLCQSRREAVSGQELTKGQKLGQYV